MQNCPLNCEIIRDIYVPIEIDEWDVETLRYAADMAMSIALIDAGRLRSEGNRLVCLEKSTLTATKSDRL